ncbi:hypothetical protein A2955_04645 [Candidatus Woesebacteria bacterium RIFCSPLOWO2_01_FULL_37_19]|uniref:Uncharacterized protein n=2 Tax=Candidatus Woeseibacteriota TaxID=1752722 RepID=A0A1F8BAL3_9BACT|nr:MAG: hypothetical protein A2771_01605 [Candidatus Woesebacteria bacterium RIFCSPHIGHO2_01_FULL_38_26b]OGM61084.1 MAG: hypothetical protein A2955_04645 [Candidatus Woesebacteria bacterium RIFCSPLOWO2_01_FULL_37_19]
MNLKSKLKINIAVLVAAIFSDAVFIGLIIADIARNEDEKVLIAFLLVSSLVLTVGAILALVLSVWIVLGRRYLERNIKEDAK